MRVGWVDCSCRPGISVKAPTVKASLLDPNHLQGFVCPRAKHGSPVGPRNMQRSSQAIVEGLGIIQNSRIRLSLCIVGGRESAALLKVWQQFFE